MTQGHDRRFRCRLFKSVNAGGHRIQISILLQLVRRFDILIQQVDVFFRVESNCCVFELSWCGMAQVDVSIQPAGICFFVVCPIWTFFSFLI